jgi:hypothetical protein
VIKTTKVVVKAETSSMTCSTNQRSAAGSESLDPIPSNNWWYWCTKMKTTAECMQLHFAPEVFHYGSVHITNVLVQYKLLSTRDDKIYTFFAWAIFLQLRVYLKQQILRWRHSTSLQERSTRKRISWSRSNLFIQPPLQYTWCRRRCRGSWQDTPQFMQSWH